MFADDLFFPRNLILLSRDPWCMVVINGVAGHGMYGESIGKFFK